MRRPRLATSTVVVALVVGATGLAGGADAAPSEPPWHLERVTERVLALDGVINRPLLTGAGVDVYVVDEYVRPTHVEYAGRVGEGRDVVGDVVNTASCGGHGTHVAGLVAGVNQGVARGARIIPVRVLDCGGDGTVPGVIDALDWIGRRQKSGRISVVNLSLGLPVGSTSVELENEIRRLIADGIVVVIAAGNGDASMVGVDACATSPARTTEALVVGATLITDAVAPYSNVGACVDLFAPGGSIVGSEKSVESSWITDDVVYDLQSGTSMASPLVAGYAALLGEQQPRLCPEQISAAIVERATTGAISGLGPTSPNRLLYLDPTPLTVAGLPGRPTNVLVSGNNAGIYVSWDPPCDGGSSLLAYRVVVRSKGRVVRRVDVPADRGGIRIAKLRNGTRYSVTVRAINAVGEGPFSDPPMTAKARRLRIGSSTRTSTILRDVDGFAGQWMVDTASTKVCALRGTPQKLVVRRKGACIVHVMPRDAEYQVTHRIAVG